ncbi:MAG: TIGR03621 family F420-dependent LLM class oxidoreductase [Chloroflexi bacterium]|nr:MAG: TIGR03621 family F420-dependent LLM class oxidoreductase [Chloroflexota bacterium]
MATRPLTFAYPAPIITAGPRARCPFRSEIPQDIRPPGPAYARGVRPLRFGLSASTTASRREWQELARRAEAAGFDVLQVADHLDECLPPLTALCSAADVTERLHEGGYRLARAATVALLTDGRFELGLGAGYNRREYDQVGLPYDPASTRVSRLAESVEVIRRLLDGEELTFRGAHYRVSGHRVYPLPPRRPRLLIGGNGDRLLTVAARQADVVGFAGGGPSRDGVRLSTSGMTAAGLADRVALVRERAGARFDALDLHVLIQFVIVTDQRRRGAEDPARRFGFTADQVLDSPFFLIGTPLQMADALRERQERFGVNYWTVFARRPGSEQTAETLAPVIAHLR